MWHSSPIMHKTLVEIWWMSHKSLEVTVADQVAISNIGMIYERKIKHLKMNSY